MHLLDKINDLPRNPAKDTKKQREARLNYIFSLVRLGATVDSAARKCGTTRKSFYSWLNNDPELMAHYEEIKIELHDKVGEVAKLCALKALTDPRYQTSMIFYLKSRAGWNDGSGFVAAAQEMPSIHFQPQNNPTKNNPLKKKTKKKSAKKSAKKKTTKKKSSTK